MNSDIPNLQPGCNSWIVVNITTGKAVVEIWNKETAERINFKKYKLVTTRDWLVSLNNRLPQ